MTETNKPLPIQPVFNTQRGLRLKVAKELGITHGAVSQWDVVPAPRCVVVEKLTGVPRHVLRPDVFPAPADESAQ
jgi:DNA-binding transcriptional regulator YdaS (Cro superfamily)